MLLKAYLLLKSDQLMNSYSNKNVEPQNILAATWTQQKQVSLKNDNSFFSPNM